ncbi:YpjP family protein [Bacillus sp. Bva_UNVM-123]|uniref:YpjP family protein n=1 Tax=Bacillus sp. Bva_UNVM-123 TaxID=2829798 RepID=UPI00391F2EBA
MPKWLRKSFVIIVTILTFGLVTPSQAFLYDHSSAVKPPKKDIVEDEKCEINSAAAINDETGFLKREDFMKRVLDEAEAQSFTKFGTKIKPVIENEFTDLILPNIERAISNVADQFPEEELSNLIVSETPGRGHSEKIFHITNTNTNEDIIRFHVRRDHPPKQGYWFNFHYHTHHDKFQSHHDLGSIYWNKNTPPKWMS